MLQLNEQPYTVHAVEISHPIDINYNESFHTCTEAIQHYLTLYSQFLTNESDICPHEIIKKAKWSFIKYYANDQDLVTPRAALTTNIHCIIANKGRYWGFHPRNIKYFDRKSMYYLLRGYPSNLHKTRFKKIWVNGQNERSLYIERNLRFREHNGCECEQKYYHLTIYDDEIGQIILSDGCVRYAALLNNVSYHRYNMRDESDHTKHIRSKMRIQGCILKNKEI
jgi:hypothetical protein